MFNPDKLKLSDVLTGTLRNTGNIEQEIQLKSKIFKEGKMIAEISSQNFKLAAKTNLLLNSANASQWIEPVQIQFYDAAFEQQVAQIGYLQGKDYQICTMVKDATNNQALMEDVCTSYNSNTVFAPMLIRPINQATLAMRYPLFAWSFSQPFSTANYTLMLKIKEILEGQSEVNAMESNPVFYEVDVSNLQLFQYPIEAQTLDSCKKYAWQITVYEGKTIYVGEDEKARVKRMLAQSEVESFGMQCTSSNPIAKIAGVPEIFYVLQRNLSEEYHTTQGGNICFKYEEPYNSNVLNYKIYNWKREVKMANTLSHSQGTHYYTLNGSGLNVNELYFLEIEDAKKQVYKMKFLYK